MFTSALTLGNGGTMMRMASTLLAALTLVACGGTDLPADDGSGGSASDASGSPVGSGSGLSTSAGGGEPVGPYETCEMVFEDAAEAGCPLHPLLAAREYCEDEVDSSGACEALRGDLFACQGEQLAVQGCGAEAACASDRVLFLACVYPPDGSGETTCDVAPDGDKVCTTNSSEHAFTSECSTRDDGSFACSCKVDGEAQGTCLGIISDDTDGCCRTWFADAS
jgi:hypothetical protein